jgi:hypothetical protein
MRADGDDNFGNVGSGTSSISTQQIARGTNPTAATGVNTSDSMQQIAASENPTAAMGANQPTVDAPVETYWEPRTLSRGDDLKLFLYLFESASGALSKRKPLQWAFIMEKIIPQLLEAAFIAKEQAIRQRLDVADSELKELSNTTEDLDNEDVYETEEEATEMDN